LSNQVCQHYSVRQADIETFARDGVVCLRSVLDSTNVSRLAEALDELSTRLPESATGYDVTTLRRHIFERQNQTTGTSAHQHDIEAIADLVRASGAAALVDEGETGDGHFLLDTTTWRRNCAIRALALDSDLPSVAAQLLGATRINYCDDQIFVKAAHTADRTAFHQDYTYFRMRGWKGCVMWISVDHADAVSGVLSYVRGSHLWGRKFLPNVFMAHVSLPGGVGESLEAIEAHPENHDLVQFDVQPGDIVVHHFRTVHGAGGNHSDHPRRALSLRYAGEDMRYHNRPGAPAQPYQTHALVEGAPLDSEAFPVVWPKPFPDFSLAKAHYDRMPVPGFGELHP
jgi:ectoine hydroxylase-related dioxygenase (phytanoyl-CoA dioxygenase family)